MKVGDFAIFRGLPVKIEAIDGEIAEIKYCFELSEVSDVQRQKNLLNKVQNWSLQTSTKRKVRLL